MSSATDLTQDYCFNANPYPNKEPPLLSASTSPALPLSRSTTPTNRPEYRPVLSPKSEARDPDKATSPGKRALLTAPLPEYDNDAAYIFEERPVKRQRLRSTGAEVTYIAGQQESLSAGFSWESEQAQHTLTLQSSSIYGSKNNLELRSQEHYDYRSLSDDATQYTAIPGSTSCLPVLVKESSETQSANNCDTIVIAAGSSSNDEVCFGMIDCIPLQLIDNSAVLAGSKGQSVFNDAVLDSEGAVHLERDGSLLGSIGEDSLSLLSLLCEDLGIALQLRGVVRCSSPSPGEVYKRRGKFTYHSRLIAILYGPLSVFERVGAALEDHNIDLQDPTGCYRNVKYRNPHRLSGLQQNPPMTIATNAEAVLERREIYEQARSCLDDLSFDQNLTLAETPSAVETNLFDHQRQALHFMQEREKGWNLSGSTGDLWKVLFDHNSLVYLNTLTGDTTTVAPPPFHGGLLADTMGLGKTLTTLSLVASDLDPTCSTRSTVPEREEALPCTLIIVPPALLHTWKTQFRQHCKLDQIRLGLHHGRHRFVNECDIATYSIVLTSYHTVSFEHRNLSTAKSLLFSHKWHRIILDEAHLIREETSQMAKAICALKADRRWALTGTPIQNHVTDFLSLLQFLRVYPYNKPSFFERDILRLWKVDHEAAIERFKKLITAITLRRTNDVINLTPRADEVRYLHLSASERGLYETVEIEADSAISIPQDQNNSYQHVWQSINALRSICNHGVLAPRRSKGIPNRLQVTATIESEQHSICPSRPSPSKIACPKCMAGVKSLIMIELPEDSKIVLENVHFTSDMAHSTMICKNCLYEFSLQPMQPDHEDQPSANRAEFIGTSDHGASFRDSIAMRPLPTKIKALIADLQAHKESKSIVFSSWSTTLDIIIEALKASGILYVRYDGRVTDKGRVRALTDFRVDPTIKVILMTISCGAVGLDITAADRAYLIEPQWNPTVEDQALARIHRLGQTRPVTTVRYIIEDSIEQRVVALQKRKRGFADLLLSSNRRSIASNFGNFQCLKSLLR